MQKTERQVALLRGGVGFEKGRRMSGRAGGVGAALGFRRLPGDGGGLGPEQVDAARLMRQGLVEFVAFRRDIFVEQTRAVEQRLHEIEGPPDVQAEKDQAEQRKAMRRLRQPVDMAVQEFGGLRALRARRGEAAEPGLLVIREPVGGPVQDEAEDRVGQQALLSLERIERAQRADDARGRTAGLGEIAGQILEIGERIAGKAETAQARLEGGPDPPRKGIDARAGRVIEQRFGQGRAARLGLRQGLPLAVQFFPQRVELFMGGSGIGAGVGADMGAFLRRLVGQGAVGGRQRAIKGGGKGAFGLGGEIGRAQRGDRRRAGAAEFSGQPGQGAALAAARRREKADGEGRGRVGTAQQLGGAVQQGLGQRRQGELARRGRRVGLERRRGRAWRNRRGDLRRSWSRSWRGPRDRAFFRRPGQLWFGSMGRAGGEKIGRAISVHFRQLKYQNYLLSI